ncbi:hypothetical protein [Actinophytocola sp.]|uniref:hypothetical protein n=1 Tax=Actinophytocola sp. TaxID=1872138 RepID=UPI002ED21596
MAVLLAFVVTSCSDGGGSGSTTTSSDTTSTSEEATGGDSEAVAWADEVCSGIKDEVSALTTTPELDQSNPQAAKDGLVTYLGTLETSLDGMASAVEGAGTPPVDGGDEAVKSFIDQIGTAKESVTSAKSKIEAAPVDDPAAFQAAAAAAVQDLQALSSMDPTSAFSDNEELNAAYNDAPACQELESGSSSPTT